MEKLIDCFELEDYEVVSIIGSGWKNQSAYISCKKILS